MNGVRTTENRNFQFVLQGSNSQSQQMVGESGSNFQIILYGDKSTSQDLTVNEPPAYRSTYVSGAQVNDAGHLILSFSDGSTVDSGYVKGNTGERGPQGVSVEWRGEWSAASSYNYLDCVTFGGNVYIYIAESASAGSAVTDTSKWDLVLKRGEPGADGTNGVTFTPLVSSDGVLSWTNNGNLENPISVNIKGQPGNGFKILGYYSTVSALMSSVVSPSAGDAYGVGTSEPYDIYIFDGVTEKWLDNGQLQGAKGESGTTFTPSVSSDGILSWSNNDGKENPPSVNIKGGTGADGASGQDGTTFTPSVSAAGVLSWTNDGGKQNPASVSIKGPAGAAGKDPEPFYVTCTLSGQDVYDEGATHDKSFAEILTAHQAGRPCRAILKLDGSAGDNTLLLPLAELNANATDGYVKFALTEMTQGDTPEELRVCYAWIHSTDAAEGFWGSRYTLSGDETFMPDVTASDNGKFLRVSNGAWTAVTITNANGGSF